MKQKATITLNFITSVLFYIAAAIGYFNDSSMATVWLCLGSMWLCLGAFTLNKARTNSEKNKDENKSKN